MISIFRQYNITPLFVFDGKPPVEKYETIKRRREDRYLAQTKYNELLLSMNGRYDSAMKQELDGLKRKIVKINENDVNKVKQLMDLYGVSYYTAVGESDVFCCYMVLAGRADACLSDDTDMFMYNCPIVLRNFSILNHTMIEHNTQEIFNELAVDYNTFKLLLLLVCNDYNNTHYFEIEELIQLFREYKNANIEIHFYTWLNTNKNIDIDVVEIDKIKNLYHIDYEQHRKYADTIVIENRNPNTSMLYEVLKTSGFICYANDETKFPIHV
jgi:5'-3' exonuclease